MLSHCDRLAIFFKVYFCLVGRKCIVDSVITFVTLVNSLVMDCIHTHTRKLKLRYGINFVRHPRHMILAKLKTLYYNVFTPVVRGGRVFRPVVVFIVPLLVITVFSGVATFTHLGRYHGLLDDGSGR